MRFGSPRGRSEVAVAGRENVLRIWLAWCVERGLLRRSPLDGVRCMQTPNPPVEILSGAELERLLGHTTLSTTMRSVLALQSQRAATGQLRRMHGRRL